MCTDQAAFTKTVQNSYVRVDFYVRGKSKKDFCSGEKHECIFWPEVTVLS